VALLVYSAEVSILVTYCLRTKLSRHFGTSAEVSRVRSVHKTQRQTDLTFMCTNLGVPFSFSQHFKVVPAGVQTR